MHSPPPSSLCRPPHAPLGPLDAGAIGAGRVVNAGMGPGVSGFAGSTVIVARI